MISMFLRIYDIIKFLISKSDYKYIKQADIIISTNDTDKSYIYKNKLYSPIADSFVEYLKKYNNSYIAISLPGSKFNKKQTLLNYLNINREYYISKIKNFFSNEDELILFWKKIFKKVNPKIIICIQPPPEMCVAAKKCNIKIFDIQHGLINNLIYYNLQNSYGEKGLPNIIFCWDKISTNYLKKILPNVSSCILGNPWIAYLDKKNTNKFINLEIKKVRKVPKKQPVIIITLQWKRNYTKQIIDIPEHIIKCLKRLVNGGWNCWLRFHPAHLKEFSKDILQNEWNKKTNLKINSINIYDLSDSALPYLLRFANAHITNFSASIIEAKIMKVPSYIWCKDKNIKANLFQPYLNTLNIYEVPPNINKFVKLINKHKVKKKTISDHLTESKKKYFLFRKKYLQ
jgi:hypothetical protein